MIYYIILAGIIVYSIIAGNMMMTVIATAFVVLPFSYAAAKGIGSHTSQATQLIIMCVLAAVGIVGLMMNAFPVAITAALIMVCYALGYSRRVGDFIRFKTVNVGRQVDRHPVLRDDWMKRKPIDPSAFDMKDLEDAGMYDLPHDTTHGIPGRGIEHVSELGSRAKAGAKGEIVLAGMLFRSGLLDIPGVHSFWSMKTPNNNVDIDVDCAILYGDELWLLDAKRYLPDDGNEYLLRDIEGSEYSYNGIDAAKYHPVLRMVRFDDATIHEFHNHNASWSKEEFDTMIQKVNSVMERSKKYTQTQSDSISQDAITPIMVGMHREMSIHSYVVLTPTSMGVPGVGTDTDYEGGIPLDQANVVIDSIKNHIMENPTNIVHQDVIARLDSLVKDNEWNHYLIT